MSSETLPDGVRKVAGPAVRWQVLTTYGHSYDGYVFEDDPSDLARFMRWLAEEPQQSQQCRLNLQKVQR
jgi:hypothetical protein